MTSSETDTGTADNCGCEQAAVRMSRGEAKSGFFVIQLALISVLLC